MREVGQKSNSGLKIVDDECLLLDLVYFRNVTVSFHFVCISQLLISSLAVKPIPVN